MQLELLDAPFERRRELRVSTYGGIAVGERCRLEGGTLPQSENGTDRRDLLRCLVIYTRISVGAT